ncbi:MAG: polyprenyl synthetase family protein [Chloroflexota bacterium]
MTLSSAATAFSLVNEDIKIIEGILEQTAKPQDPTMEKLLGLVLPGSGKRLRPVLALLCGRVNRIDRDKLIPFAAALELLHTASLVHDDVVDESPMRRGEPTVSAKIKNSIAVLVGDYLFAQAAAHAATTSRIDVINAFTRTSMAIITGQIDESWSDGKLSLTKERYFKRIGGKTAALFALSAEGGAMLSNATEDVVRALEQFGYKLGLAFQIVDDILDVIGDERNLGKPVGSDIRQGVVTLPALLVRHLVPPPLFESAYSGDGESEEAIEALLHIIRTEGGVENSYAEADRLKAEACSALQILPDTPVRQALIDLAEIVVQRDV